MNVLLKNKIETNISNFYFTDGLALNTIPEKEREFLLAHAKTIKLAKKEVLYAEGEPPKGIYILTKGKIKISQLNFDGTVQIIFIYGANELFGHRPILANDKHPVTASALEPCELLFVEKEFFQTIVRESEAFCSQLIQSISQEFTVMVNRINLFAQRGIKERLALFLLVLNEKFKFPGQLTEESDINMSRNDLAGYIGTSVENLVRTIKVFKDNGYIETSGKSIYIKDFETLYSMTGI